MDPEQRRATLVRTALTIFARDGIGEASHSAVAREARVAVPTVFHYFSTKDELVDAALEEVSRFLIDDLLRRSDDPEVSARAAIETVLMAFCDSIDTDPDYVRVWLEWSVSIRGTLWQSYLEFHRKSLAGIRRIIRRGIAAGSIRRNINLDDGARVIVGIAHMVAQMKFSGASRAQVKRTVHSLVSGYLAG